MTTFFYTRGSSGLQNCSPPARHLYHAPGNRDFEAAAVHYHHATAPELLQALSFHQVHLAADVALQACQAGAPLVVALGSLTSSLDVSPVPHGPPEDAVPASCSAFAAGFPVDCLQHHSRPTGSPDLP